MYRARTLVAASLVERRRTSEWDVACLRPTPNPEVLVSHGSARTLFHGRLLIVQRHQAGWPQAHIARAMGISRKCVKTWLERYAAEGEAGLRDRSSRPHSSPRRTSPEVESQVIELRGRERRGPAWIGAE